MAVYQFSALSDGQAISFDASADRLNFDQTSVAAGDLTLTSEASGLRVTVKSGTQAGKDVLLTGFTLEQIAASNFSFADGSAARVGDNVVATANDHGNNALAGTAGRDLLMGLGGNDNLQGGDNNDSLVGGFGNDTLNGNSGNDWLQGDEGNDVLTGSGGQDTFLFREFGSFDADTLPDFASNWDRIELDAARFPEIGAAGRFTSNDPRFFAGTAAHDADDRIIFNAATGQILYDFDGNGSGMAQLIATLGAGRGVVASDFTVVSLAGSGNVLNGTAGDDTLIGTPNDDTLNGFGGNDSLVGGEGADSLNGGDGNDTLNAWTFGTGDGVVDTLNGGLGDDVYMVHNDGVEFGGVADLILADPGGTDTVRVLNGNWTLGAGLENLDLDDNRGISADGTGNDLDNVIRSASEGGTLSGLGGNDTLVARHAQNVVTLLGGDGNDTLFGGWHTDFDGGAGNDLLVASATIDLMAGGSGADIFQFGLLGDASISDFASGTDKVQLDGTNLTQIGASGNFAAGDARFFAGSAAHDADDRVIWDGTTLWYDADGNGSGEQLLVARVTGNVVATDITVINGTASGGTINGTEGDDTLTGTGGNDTINGFGGNDSITGGFGLDSLTGGDGNDTLDGSSFEQGETGEADTLAGGLGDDLYVVGANDVTVDSGGIDSVIAWDTDWTLAAGLENLRLMPTGRSDAQRGTGNDLNNIIDPSGLEHGSVYHGLGGNDTIFSAQRDGSYFGDDGDDLLDGSFNNGNELLFGGNGNDTLIAAGNGGQMTGDAGGDSFVYLNAGNGGVVTDFATGSDKIHLDASTMSALGTTGSFTAGDARFFAGAGATSGHDADDRVIYDTSTGAFYYDADGSGAGLGILIGTLQGAPSFAATDIVVDNGTPSGSTINGTAGNDTLVGGDGDDTLNGLGGNDLLIGNGGNDSLAGGDGNDIMDAIAGQENPFRTTDPDQNTLSGGLGDDVFIAWGNDVLQDAGGFSRLVISGPGSYVMPEGFDNLRIAFSAETDEHFFITANSSSNVIIPAGFRNTIDAGDGNDRIYGNIDRDNINGGNGDDWLHGGDFFDGLTGGAGTDHFVFDTRLGFSNEDVITDFSSGVDKIHVDNRVMTALGATGSFAAGDARFAAGASLASGQDASDRIVYNTTTGNLYYDADGSGSGEALLMATLQGAPALVATDLVVENGGIPGTVIYGTNRTGSGGQDEFINGTQYNDTMLGLSGNDAIAGNLGNDSIDGGDGNDVIVGGEGNDTMLGGAGDDTFDLPWVFPVGPSSGADVIDGGAGFDAVRFNFNSTATSGIVLNLGAGTVTGGSPGASATLAGIESVSGTSFADSMLGSAAGDVLFSEEGADTLNGAGGNDTLTGGGGADAFLFNTAPGGANADLFTDFTSGTDEIRLDGSVMTALGASGDFTAGDARFFAAAGANAGHDANDRIVYNTSTQQLWYDADGSGAGAAQLIATLANPSGPVALQATDIAVVNGGSGGGGGPGSTIIGTSGNDSLAGGTGNDSINGGSGNDSLWGAGGNDTLTGSGGQDTFIFRESGAGNADRMTDFATNWDRIQVDDAAFTEAGAAGRLASGDSRFFAGSAAHDADDRFVFDGSTGQLYYDADGNGAGAAQLVATVQAGAGIAATDITVI